MAAFSGVNQKWNGLWFPGPPGQTVPITSQESSVSREGISRFLPIDDSSVHCDDGTVDRCAFLSGKYNFTPIYL